MPRWPLGGEAVPGLEECDIQCDGGEAGQQEGEDHSEGHQRQHYSWAHGGSHGTYRWITYLNLSTLLACLIIDSLPLLELSRICFLGHKHQPPLHYSELEALEAWKWLADICVSESNPGVLYQRSSMP